ncbi:uncharacterized protein MYCGRDRAFT_97970 [Zymoseptoria tritici IPO323]|uniref:Uncharacterized protein n=1 Tax=Zymoseptoria tritici (strain CBS 115943 / IPO323) TaxID=336722 RepID=F9XRX7_ZYMTI|nr:uncharacterized protein MYCGRDRAFT_97970 [Zymoseptoria tritici IPO323]EGP81996.1 hypothetical protein MYCGRDRAFT_97970 [Zymoseptoria tritici IPO323]
MSAPLLMVIGEFLPGLFGMGFVTLLKGFVLVFDGGDVFVCLQPRLQLSKLCLEDGAARRMLAWRDVGCGVVSYLSYHDIGAGSVRLNHGKMKGWRKMEGGSKTKQTFDRGDERHGYEAQ